MNVKSENNLLSSCQFLSMSFVASALLIIDGRHHWLVSWLEPSIFPAFEVECNLQPIHPPSRVPALALHMEPNLSTCRAPSEQDNISREELRFLELQGLPFQAISKRLRCCNQVSLLCQGCSETPHLARRDSKLWCLGSATASPFGGICPAAEALQAEQSVPHASDKLQSEVRNATQAAPHLDSDCELMDFSHKPGQLLLLQHVFCITQRVRQCPVQLSQQLHLQDRTCCCSLAQRPAVPRTHNTAVRTSTKVSKSSGHAGSSSGLTRACRLSFHCEAFCSRLESRCERWSVAWAALASCLARTSWTRAAESASSNLYTRTRSQMRQVTKQGLHLRAHLHPGSKHIMDVCGRVEACHFMQSR